MPAEVRADDAARLHDRLRGTEAAEPILVVDQRQQPLVDGFRRVAVSGEVCGDRRAHEVGDHRRCHAAGGAGIEIGQEGDSFLAVEWALDGVTAGGDERAQLVRRLGAFDLEAFDRLDFPRHAHKEIDRQLRAGQRRVLHHDRDASISGRGELREDLVRRAAQQRAVIGRHQHDHVGPEFGRLACTGHDDVRREMARRDDHGHAAGDMLQGQPGQPVALVVRQQELLREVREDADAIHALVDHAIQDPGHAFGVDLAVVGEGCGCDGPDTAVSVGDAHPP